jgi:hypothetical protein
MNKILRGKTIPSKLAIQPARGVITSTNVHVIVNLGNNQLNHSREQAILITRKAASLFTSVWDQSQL